MLCRLAMTLKFIADKRAAKERIMIDCSFMDIAMMLEARQGLSQANFVFARHSDELRKELAEYLREHDYCQRIIL